MKASDLTEDFRFFALFVGDSGSGKTVAEGSFPQPIDFEDFDGRIRGLLGAPWINRDKITYDTYPPRYKGALITGDPNYMKISNKLGMQMQMMQTGNLKLETKVIDSLTSETFSMLCDAMPHTHEGSKGKKIGQMPMSGPEDYNFEATGTYDLMSALRAMKVPNVIVSAHLIDRFGKSDPDNPFSESIVIGKKLSVRDKIGTNVQIYFDHIFVFEREGDRFYVTFKGSGMARTSYASLPAGRHDITGKHFYNYMMSFVKKEDLTTKPAA